jgi:hypothetical protein
MLFAEDVSRSSQETTSQIQALDASKRDVEKLPEIYRQLLETTKTAVSKAADRHDMVRKENSDALGALSNARGTLAGAQEDYARLEFNLGILSAEARRLNEKLYMYRFLAPEIQAEVGDNGPHISAEVVAVSGSSLTLSKGSRHGIQLYQKFSILNGNGLVVGVANVTEVRNGTAEAEIRTLPQADRGMTPAVGHIAVPRQLNFSLDNPGLTGR